MTLVVNADGSYSDSSGLLMPPLYPDTQMCEYEETSNRVHFWYLDLVYSGQHFYQHFFYEVVAYDGYTLEMHYNFWDDPEPHPEVQTITLTRVEGGPPAVFMDDFESGDTSTWSETAW